MAKAKSPIPEGFRTITPNLMVNGAAKYMEFLKGAFGAVEVCRMGMPDGRLMHAEARIGDSIVMFNDAFPEFGGPEVTKGPLPFTLHLYVPDADAAFARATNAGCEVKMPLEDQFWGDRYGMLTDPFGVNWSIATHKEELTPEEMTARQKAAFSSGASHGGD